MDNLNIVLVEWADACGEEPGWLSLEDLEDDGEVVVSTVGFLIPADDPGGKHNHVTVMQSYHDGEAIHVFHIPVGMVRKMTVVNCQKTLS
jgi:hypothetical protein